MKFRIFLCAVYFIAYSAYAVIDHDLAAFCYLAAFFFSVATLAREVKEL